MSNSNEIIISSADYERLQKIQENKNLITLEYLNNLQHKLSKFVYNNFFYGETFDAGLQNKAKEKFELLKQSYALPYKISSVKAKFVGKPISLIHIKDIDMAVLSFVYGGYSVFTIDELDDDGKPVINVYNAEQYVRDGELEKILTYLKDDDNNTYIFVKVFNEEVGKIHNLLYKTIENSGQIIGQKVELSHYFKDNEFEEWNDFKTTKSLIRVEHDLKIKNYEYGTSQFEFIKQLIYNLDLELINISDQFIKHLQAKLAIEGIDASKMPKDNDGNILMREAEVIFMQPGMNKPEYISNKNELLTSIIEVIDKHSKVIATNCSVPLELVGLSGQVGTESTESKLLRYSDFIKDIENIQNKFSDVYFDFYDVILDIYPSYFDSDKKEFTCKWNRVMPQDGLKLAQEISVAKIGGFVSLRTAVKTYLGIDGEDLDDELKQLEEEKAKSLDNFSLI